MSDSRIRVLLAEDHEIVRKGLSALLTTEPDITVVGEVCNGRMAVAEVPRVRPDVVLMDLVMPQMGGVEAIREIRAQGATCRILVLTSYGTDDKLFPALRAGAVGYLLKDTSPEELTRAIRDAARGRSHIDATVAGRLLREISTSGESADSIDALTGREREVLREIARGGSNESIAARLYVSKATVRTHVSNILGKLGLSNRTQAAMHALRIGLISVDELESEPPEVV